MEVGKKIKFYREARGLTQAKLCQMAGISLSSLKKYEAGERGPKPSQLERIASALGVSAEILQDIHPVTDGEFLHYFITLAKTGNIQFHGNCLDDRTYDINSLSFSFNSPLLMRALKEWADKKLIIDHLHEEANNCPDDVTQEYMLQRANEIEQTLELSLIDLKDNIIDE